MSSLFVQDGDVIELVAETGGVTVDVPVLYGSILVLPLATAAVGVQFSAQVTGVWTLPKTSAQAWTEGEKVYWDDANSRCDTDSTVGPLIGVSAVIAANPSATANVRMNGTAPDIAEGPQAAIVTLTDSTGDSGTHDDTLADGLTSVAPAAATTNAITDSTGGTPSTSALADLADGSTYATDHAAIENNFATLGAEAELLKADVAALAAIVATLVTDVTVQNQNDSDLAQKIIQILAALVAAGIIDA